MQFGLSSFLAALLSLTTFTTLTLAAPAPAPVPSDAPSQTCENNQELACCDAIDNLGIGTGCVFGFLNFLNPTCPGQQNQACCSGDATGLVVVQCVPLGNINL